jgi:hypothetical protein
VGNLAHQNVTIRVDGTAPASTITLPTPDDAYAQPGALVSGTVSEEGPLQSGAQQVEISFSREGVNDLSSATWRPDALWLHLPLDEPPAGSRGQPTSRFHDASGNMRHASCAGAGCPVAGGDGYYGHMARFDGNDDWLQTGPLPALDSAWSAALWVRPAGGSGVQPFFDIADSSGNSLLTLRYNASNRRFSVATGGTVYGDDSLSSFAPNQWHYLLLSVDAGGQATLYGASVDLVTFSTPVRPVAGGRLRVGGTGSAFFAGQIDDVVIYGRALSHIDRRQHLLGFAPVIRLGFDKYHLADGEALPDGSRYGQSAVLRTGGQSRYAAPGIVGAGALALDGVDDYISVASSLALRLGGWWYDQYSQAVWVNAGSVDHYQPIISGPDGYPYLGIDGRRVRYGFGAHSRTTPQEVINPGQWNHIVMSRDRTEARLYVNGVLADSVTYPANATLTLEDRFEIGRDQATTFRGRLDEFAIYRYPLSAEEVAALYQQRWRPTTLATGPASGTTWSHTIPTELPEGTYRIELRARDVAGNESLGAQGQGRWVGLVSEDEPSPPETPPVVTVTFGDPDGDNGWFKSGPVVGSVTATTASTIAGLECSGATLSDVTGIGTGTATGTLTITADGEHPVSCTATDGASPPDTDSSDVVVIKLDRGRPTVTLASRLPEPNAAGWNNSAVTVMWTCADTLSGVVETTVAQVVTGQGTNRRVTGTCTDQAGNTATDTQSGFKIDRGRPTITLASRLPEPNAAGWNNSAVTVTWTCADTLSGVVEDTVSQVITVQGTNRRATGTCTDQAGNTATNKQMGINIDTRAPVVVVTGVAHRAQYTLGAVPEAGCTTIDTLSGVATDASLTGAYESGVGTFTTTCTGATDVAGNVAADRSVTYRVLYDFAGFEAPVANQPVVNVMDAGAAVPVRFSLGGNQGLNIMADTFPRRRAVTCDSTSDTQVVGETIPADASSLSYDEATGQYTYLWKTGRSLRGTCRELVIRLADGTRHVLNFQFTMN